MDESGYAVLGTNAGALVACAVTIVLLDRVGRRSLLLATTAAMIPALVLLTVALSLQTKYRWTVAVSCACVVVYYVLFNLGLGPLPVIIAAEIFAQEHRATAMAVTVVFNRVFRIAVGMSFESFQRQLGGYSFVPFAVFTTVFFVFAVAAVPETMHRGIEEIAAEMAEPLAPLRRRMRVYGVQAGGGVGKDDDVGPPSGPPSPPPSPSMIVTTKGAVLDRPMIDETERVTSCVETSVSPLPLPSLADSKTSNKNKLK